MSGFRVHSTSVPGPATHAIVIGVGHYPHLNGGGGTLSADRDGMGQLSSPTVSAREVATWLIENLDDPSKPLASVALLLSERRHRPFKHPDGTSHRVERATIANVATAIAEWKAAGDTSPEHRLLFYFCGHGIAEGPEVALLMADFGSDPNDALQGALDFTKFHVGMDAAAARQQAYFVDACRASSDSLISTRGYAGRPVIAPNVNAARHSGSRLAPIYYSTLGGDNAYGHARKPSVFTSALLRSLSGAGADDTHGEWRVETTQLFRAIAAYMQRAISSGQPRAQVPTTSDFSNFELHRLDTDTKPVVPVSVQCLPSQDTAAATIKWGLRGKRPKSRRPMPDPLEIELPTGEYEFRAEIDGQPSRMKTITVRPVERRIDLEAGR